MAIAVNPTPRVATRDSSRPLSSMCSAPEPRGQRLDEIAINCDYYVSNSPSTSRAPNASPSSPVSVGSPKRPPNAYGRSYKLKQYGTDLFILIGTGTAIALLLSPEPFLTKIIGTIIATSSSLGGLCAKHIFYKRAYLAQGLAKSVDKLSNNIEKLETDVIELREVRQGLQHTTSELRHTKSDLGKQVQELRKQVTRLKHDVTIAFDKLNQDRSKFENEKRIKLMQLNSQINEADQRETNAVKELEKLNSKNAKLRSMQLELEQRRRSLVKAEARLQELQNHMLRANLET